MSDEFKGTTRGRCTAVAHVGTPPSLPIFIPENPSACSGIQGMFMDAESADVVFEVGGQHAANEAKQKKIKTSKTEFYAHRPILMKVAPALADMIKMSHDVTPTRIAICDVSSCIFNIVLRYMYGHPIHESWGDIARTKEILDAANRFEAISLKLTAEAKYVSSVTLTVENVMDELTYAESMHCALLKEKVVDFIVENAAKLKSKVLTGTPEGLINDILLAVARREGKGGVHGMGISELRREAYNKGLNIGGSREMLIAILGYAG